MMLPNDLVSVQKIHQMKSCGNVEYEFMFFKRQDDKFVTDSILIASMLLIFISIMFFLIGTIREYA